MLTGSLSALQAAKAAVAELEANVAAERRQALSAQPVQYGFSALQSFIRDLRETEDRPRARISEATRAEVKNLLGAGKTGAEIAATTGISLASVQTIEKSLGLVKPRMQGNLPPSADDSFARRD
jgi:hypothetical protein